MAISGKNHFRVHNFSRHLKDKCPGDRANAPGTLKSLFNKRQLVPERLELEVPTRTARALSRSDQTRPVHDLTELLRNLRGSVVSSNGSSVDAELSLEFDRPASEAGLPTNCSVFDQLMDEVRRVFVGGDPRSEVSDYDLSMKFCAFSRHSQRCAFHSMFALIQRLCLALSFH